MELAFRTATPADAEHLNDLMTEGFDGYRSFAPEGWEPPSFADQLELLRERLARDDVWCLLAESDGAVAGHVAFMPARDAVHPVDDPELCHLWQLFVRPPHWGSGLAAELHSRAVAEAARRGYARMRLFTPAGQARARRFYEREGWSAAGPPFDERHFGFDLVEYRLPLPPR